MNKTIFSLGFFQIKWYSFLMFLAMLIACYIILKEAKRKKINEDMLVDLIFYSIIVGLVGARTYYVLFNLNYYLDSPLEILMVWKGGLAIHGALIAALLFLVTYCKKKKINLLLLLDIIVVGLLIAQAIGRWGNFFNQEAYGQIISLESLTNFHLPNFIINGMYINGYYREPTFLYESILSLIGFIIILIIRRQKQLKIGYLTSFYLIWYGIERLIVESFRADSLMLGPFKVAQVVSLLAIIASVVLFRKSYLNNRLYQTEEF